MTTSTPIMRGKVTKMQGRKPHVEVPDLGIGYSFGPCEVVTDVTVVKGDRVLVVSVGDILEDVVVVGVLDPVAGRASWEAVITVGDIAEVGAGYNPGARLEGGDVVRLRGQLRATVDSPDTLPAGTHLFRLDTDMRPSSAVTFIRVSVGTDGWVSSRLALAEDDTVELDGLTFTL